LLVLSMPRKTICYAREHAHIVGRRQSQSFHDD